MYLDAVYLRSFRSFHYDYKMKSMFTEKDFPECKRPWETETKFEDWKPCIEVPLQQPITSVVGLNEAGKSHLINSILKAVNSDSFDLVDVCRYSNECNFGNMGNPLIGLRWKNLSEELIAYLNKLVQASNHDEENNEEEIEQPATDDSSESKELEDNLLHIESMIMIYDGSNSISPLKNEDFQPRLVFVTRRE